MLDEQKTRAWQSGDVRQAWTERDTMLYALGLGLGADPLDRGMLRFVYEKSLVALPMMAAVMASPGFWMKDEVALGIDWMKLVHAEQAVRLHAPLPTQGEFIGRTRVVRLVDKGAGKGAIIHAEKTLTDAASGRELAFVESVYLCRGDGGFSTTGGDPPAPAPAALPDAPPEATADIATRPEQALVYRLSGDMNPLHADPDVATRVGFERPILHGLATWAIAGCALGKAFADVDPSRLTELRARFSAPVYPGETLRIEAWRSGREIAFRLRAVERDVLVLTGGRAVAG